MTYRSRRLFRDEVAPQRRLPRRRYIVAVAMAAIALAALAVMAAFDRKIAIIFIAAAIAVFGMLRLIASLVMLVASRVPRPRATVLRLAIANIFRPGALTPTVVMSLGLGIALLVTVLEVDANLRQQFAAALPERAPSFYFLDIPSEDVERFDAFVAQRGAARQARAGTDAARTHRQRGRRPGRGSQAETRGRVGTAERPRHYLHVGRSRPDRAWWQAIGGARIIPGRRWCRSRSRSPTALASSSATRSPSMCSAATSPPASPICAPWTGIRSASISCWCFRPARSRGAPHTEIATVTFPGGGTVAEETALLKSATDAFPGITAVRVKDALDAIAGVVMNLVLAVRAASSITLIAAVLVLGGALAAGHRHRVYDAVILKTLGATRRQLMSAYALEYLLLGAATVVFGVAAGSIAGWRIVVDLMTLPFHWQAGPAIAAAIDRGDRHDGVRTDGHVAGARPQARRRTAEFIGSL